MWITRITVWLRYEKISLSSPPCFHAWHEYCSKDHVVSKPRHFQQKVALCSHESTKHFLNWYLLRFCHYVFRHIALLMPKPNQQKPNDRLSVSDTRAWLKSIRKWSLAWIPTRCLLSVKKKWPRAALIVSQAIVRWWVEEKWEGGEKEWWTGQATGIGWWIQTQRYQHRHQNLANSSGWSK